MSAPKSKVWFASLRTNTRRNLFDKLDSLIENLGVGRFKKGHLVAVKLHFGEKGNTTFIHPPFVRKVADRVREAGALPFLTDTNTLYVGTRGNSVTHTQTAIENGFDYAVTGAPIIIADGLRGEAGVPVKVGGRHCEAVNIAREITAANGIFALTHFKCHEMTGFGGALKNVGMGCASREGKLTQHSNNSPVVDPAGCVACAECAAVCPAGAITIDKAAFIDDDICIGCGHCIPACPEGTINIRWNESTSRLQEKMIEHVKGALSGKEERALFINFVNRVSPACDCYGHSDTPIVPDAGILASTDPVAIDQASADLVNGLQGFKDSALASGHEPGGDKFRGVHPTVDWNVQLDYAESLGIGTRRYTLEEV